MHQGPYLQRTGCTDPSRRRQLIRTRTYVDPASLLQPILRVNTMYAPIMKENASEDPKIHFVFGSQVTPPAKPPYRPGRGNDAARRRSFHIGPIKTMHASKCEGEWKRSSENRFRSCLSGNAQAKKWAQTVETGANILSLSLSLSLSIYLSIYIYIYI